MAPILVWWSILLFSGFPWQVQRLGIVPAPQGLEQVVSLGAGQYLLLASSLPGQSRVLEQAGDGTLVETPEAPGLVQAPGFFSLTVMHPGPEEALLAGVEVLTPTVLRLYRWTPDRWEEVAEWALPAPATGNLAALDSSQVLVPLETGLWLARVDSGGSLQPLLMTGAPVLSVQRFLADSMLLLLQTQEGWWLWQPTGLLLPLAGSETAVAPLPLSDWAGAAFVGLDTLGTLTLWNREGQVLARHEGRAAGRFRFLPIWNQGVLGWGTTREGAPALVSFSPAVLDLKLFPLDSLGEAVWPVVGPEPRFLVQAGDSAVLLALEGAEDLLGWRIPGDFQGTLEIFGPSRVLHFHPVEPGMPLLVAGEVDSVRWRWGTHAWRLAVPAPGRILPLSPAEVHESTTGQGPQNLWIWPNPVHGRVRVEYRVTEPALVEVLLCRSNGQVLRVLDRSVRDPGLYQVETSLEGLPPGQYLVVCRRGNEIENRKLILIP